MRNNKGITLLTLIIYIIVLMIVLSILAVVSGSFYSNINEIKDTGKYISEVNKFNMYFIEDVKSNSEIYSITTNEIVFMSGIKYSYVSGSDNGIYRNGVKICENISLCNFSDSQIVVNNVTKTIVTVDLKVKGEYIFETTNEYVLKYW